MRLFSNFLDLIQAKLGRIIFVRKPFWIFQYIPIRRAADFVSYLMSGDYALHPIPFRFANVQDERAYRMSFRECRTSDVVIRHSLYSFAELFANLFHSAQIETDLLRNTRSRIENFASHCLYPSLRKCGLRSRLNQHQKQHSRGSAQEPAN